jgi:Na+/H+-dicarboxylate symporter
MKVYQKILVGLIVGVVLGLLLGPQSLILDKDTIHLVDPAKVALTGRPGDPSSRIRLPAKRPVDLRIEGRVGSGGEALYALSFKLTGAQIAAGGIPKGSNGRVAKAGDRQRAYLTISKAPPPTSGLGHRVLGWIGPIAEIFLRLILMLVVPLVFTTLTVGVASLGNVRRLERAGLVALLYFAAGTLLAVGLGMALSGLLRPGDAIPSDQAALLAEQFRFLIGDAVDRVQQAPDFVSFLVQIVPDNPIHSMASARPNILQVMFFSIMFGVALTLIPERRSRQVVRLLDKTSKVLVMVMHMVMALAPIGVCALIAQTVGVTGYHVFSALGGYLLVIAVGLALHALLATTLTVHLLTPVSVGAFWRAAWPAELIALGTASSTATLPVTMTVAEESLGVPQRISSFTIALGSSLNMPGTALFQGAALLFVAQAFGVELPMASLLTAALTIALLSAGTAAVPSAGLVSLAFVLASVGLPPIGIGLIAGFDRLVDMLRTPINVASDLAATLLVARAAREETQPILEPAADAANSERGFERRLDTEQVPYRPSDADEEDVD